jgi:hypothetical protein
MIKSLNPIDIQPTQDTPDTKKAKSALNRAMNRKSLGKIGDIANQSITKSEKENLAVGNISTDHFNSTALRIPQFNLNNLDHSDDNEDSLFKIDDIEAENSIELFFEEAKEEPIDHQADNLALAKAEEEKQAQAKVEADNLALAKAEEEKQAQAKVEADNLALAKAEEEKQAQAKVEADNLALVKAEADKQALAQAEADRLALAQAEADRLALAQAEADRLALAQAEKKLQANSKPDIQTQPEIPTLTHNEAGAQEDLNLIQREVIQANLNSEIDRGETQPVNTSRIWTPITAISNKVNQIWVNVSTAIKNLCIWFLSPSQYVVKDPVRPVSCYTWESIVDTSSGA